jgi:hypothetical protein
MEKSFLLLLVFLAFSGLFSYERLSASNEEKTMILRVTSNTPGEELQLEGAYLFHSNESPLSYIVQETPFILTIKSDTLSAMFRTKSGKGQLQVELQDYVAGEERPLLSGSGRAVVLGVNLGNTSHFVRTFM